ncbi:uncharacterized protein LOC113599481 [Acinonyx jubatus]|uniref:Uncharacterized protein LOC113599481 n=1 Tax=Acinonyx jubatus TaxID=32536 RepID=A0A6J1ZEG9_ACIJB|nr:uncharacterized protein LOC113599481 [Acinonyx jubatus]
MDTGTRDPVFPASLLRDLKNRHHSFLLGAPLAVPSFHQACDGTEPVVWEARTPLALSPGEDSGCNCSASLSPSWLSYLRLDPSALAVLNLRASLCVRREVSKGQKGQKDRQHPLRLSRQKWNPFHPLPLSPPCPHAPVWCEDLREAPRVSRPLPSPASCPRMRHRHRRDAGCTVGHLGFGSSSATISLCDIRQIPPPPTPAPTRTWISSLLNGRGWMADGQGLFYPRNPIGSQAAGGPGETGEGRSSCGRM